MRHIPLESVRSGSYLGKTLYDSDGRILLSSGIIITNNIINKLRSLHVHSLYIEDTYSDTEIEDIIKPELREKAITLIKETFSSIGQLSAKKSISCSVQQPLIPIASSMDNDSYLKSISLLAESLLNDILSNKEVLYSLVDIKSMNVYAYDHCLNVAILSLVIGISLNIDRSELINLCTGALLHDIGDIFIPKEVAAKEAPLTYEEFELMKKHTEKGYYYLKNKDFLSYNSKMIVLQHHERIDGLGYPRGLANNQINQLARIVSIADVYDTLTSHVFYRESMCASDALEYIMSHAGTIFDFNMVNVFSKVVVPFKFGTLVRLSNGDLGIVQDTLPNFPLRPNIKITKSNSSYKEGQLISLIKELSLVISNIEN